MQNNNKKTEKSISVDKVTPEVKQAIKLGELDVNLKVSLELSDANGKIVDIHQDIKIPYVKSPAFIQDGQDQVAKILNVMCLDPFEKMTRQYFIDCIEKAFVKKQFADEKTLLCFDKSSNLDNINHTGAEELKNGPVIEIDSVPNGQISLEVEKDVENQQ